MTDRYEETLDALAHEIKALRADVTEWKARADDLAAALHNCIKLAYNCDRNELPSAIITTASKAVAKYDMQAAEEMRARAAEMTRRADLIERAAELVEHEKYVKLTNSLKNLAMERAGDLDFDEEDSRPATRGPGV